jgi:hypothetical protein
MIHHFSKKSEDFINQICDKLYDLVKEFGALLELDDGGAPATETTTQMMLRIDEIIHWVNEVKKQKAKAYRTKYLEQRREEREME